MTGFPTLLFNATEVDAVPAHALRARQSSVARRLMDARYVLRRKRDGRFLGAVLRLGRDYLLQPLDAALADSGLDVHTALGMLGLRPSTALHPRRRIALQHRADRDIALAQTVEPLHALLAQLERLGIDPWDYARRSGLGLHPEPPTLRWAGRDVYGRALWLDDAATLGWQRLRAAAAADGVKLHAVSGFRGHAYQLGIIERKRRRGLALAEILTVNAAPGFSEHHSGRAIDIGTPGEPPAETSFESTPAFAWLSRRGGEFGFRLSYPRDNPHGIIYEPWHWCWHRGAAAS